MKTRILFIIIVVVFFTRTVIASTLSCSFTTAAACVSPSVIILRMASSTNSHSELPSMSTPVYGNNVICCGGVTGLGNLCNASSTVVLRLASTSNSHVEENTYSDYANKACISTTVGSTTIAYQSSNCNGYDTSLGSIASSTDSHIGTSTSYATQICGKYTLSAPQSISFSISTTTLGFGSLTSSAAHYATSDGLGSTTQTVGNTITVSASSNYGYNLSVVGPTLTATEGHSTYTINPIGGTNTASTPGTEQFGINVGASGGSGSVSSPYSGSGFAYNATTTPAVIGAESSGDGANTVYSITYIANISGSTESQSYSTVITYQATGNF